VEPSNLPNAAGIDGGADRIPSPQRTRCGPFRQPALERHAVPGHGEIAHHRLVHLFIQQREEVLLAMGLIGREAEQIFCLAPANDASVLVGHAGRSIGL
jgi:hypothetical protein